LILKYNIKAINLSNNQPNNNHLVDDIISLEFNLVRYDDIVYRTCDAPKIIKYLNIHNILLNESILSKIFNKNNLGAFKSLIIKNNNLVNQKLINCMSFHQFNKNHDFFSNIVINPDKIKILSSIVNSNKFVLSKKFIKSMILCLSTKDYYDNFSNYIFEPITITLTLADYKIIAHYNFDTCAKILINNGLKLKPSVALLGGLIDPTLHCCISRVAFDLKLIRYSDISDTNKYINTLIKYTIYNVNELPKFPISWISHYHIYNCMFKESSQLINYFFLLGFKPDLKKILNMLINMQQHIYQHTISINLSSNWIDTIITLIDNKNVKDYENIINIIDLYKLIVYEYGYNDKEVMDKLFSMIIRNKIILKDVNAKKIIKKYVDELIIGRRSIKKKYIMVNLKEYEILSSIADISIDKINQLMKKINNSKKK